MLTLTTNIKEASCITHCGKMHADEVFATAFLELLKENIVVIRVPSVDFNSIREDAIVYDIGLKEFDHHQPDNKKRPNGIPYCSFGLLWKEFGRKYLKENKIDDYEDVFERFDKDLVEQIDADDNGIFPKIEAQCKVKTLSSIIDLFNPGYDSNEDESKQFKKAVLLAKEIIEEELSNIIGKVKAKKKITNIIKNNNEEILVLDEYIPYLETLLELDPEEKIKLAVFPSNRGGYNVKTIPKGIADQTYRVPFPKNWAGLTDEDLEKESKIKGAMFCHNKLFIATAKDKDSAIKLAKKALDIYNEDNKNID